MNMKPLKVKVSITLDGDVLEQTKKLAEDDDRNLSQYINRILKEHIKAADRSLTSDHNQRQ